MSRCFVGLGGNLGSVAATFAQACELLNQAACPVAGISRIYRTAPVGDHAGDEFLNAVAAIDTDRTPEATLDLLQEIEARLGRTREIHWGPRTIDLDLLFYENVVLATRRLTVPHPAAWYRRFVLDPMCDLAPDLVHPVRQLTIRELRERLLNRPCYVALESGRHDATELWTQLAAEFPAIRPFAPLSQNAERLIEPQPAFTFTTVAAPDSGQVAAEGAFAAPCPAPVGEVRIPADTTGALAVIRGVLQAALGDVSVCTEM